MDVWNLETLWFGLIVVLWLGYFFLEGFDFGVGMLLRVLGRDAVDRRVLIHSIGPVWDGNEVWLLVAGGATFAAFPEWYATLFSGFYLALFLILVALILRGVAFEFWGKHDSPRWRATWEWAIVAGSALPALLWGVAFANIVRGVPIDGEGEFTGNLLDLLGPYGLLGGAASLLLFLSHGAVFLTLKTRGEIAERAGRAALVVSPVAAVVVAGFLAWTLVHSADVGTIGASMLASALAAAVCVALVPVLLRVRAGAAFAAGGLAIVLGFLALFFDLYPNVLVSSTDPANSLTIFTASSTHYTLTVMAVVAAVLTPVVLLYQGWTYWVFRHRLGREDVGEARSPIDLLAQRGGHAQG